MPDDDQTYGRDQWHSINQMYAKAGLRVVLPEDWEAINAMADEMDRVMCTPAGELDANPKAQAAAAEKLRDALRPFVDHMFPEMSDEAPVLRIDTTWWPDYREGDTCLRAFVYDRTADAWVWVPLQRYEQWEEVSAAYRTPKSICLVHSVRECDYFKKDPTPNPDRPLRAYAINRGEILVILLVCPACRERMDDPSWSARDYGQCGPFPWYDSA